MVNSSAAELYGLLVTSYEDYFTTSFTFSIAEGDDGYDLPFVFHKLRGVDLSLNGEFVNVSRFNFEDRNISERPGVSGCREMRYRVMGKKILITPSTQAAGDYQMWYVPKFAPMVSDDDSIDDNMSMEFWHEFIVIDAAIKMAQKEESDSVVQVLMLQKMSIVQRIQDEASNRDAAQPESVTDVSSSGRLDGWDWL